MSVSGETERAKERNFTVEELILEAALMSCPTEMTDQMGETGAVERTALWVAKEAEGWQRFVAMIYVPKNVLLTLLQRTRRELTPRERTPPPRERRHRTRTPPAAVLPPKEEPAVHSGSEEGEIEEE